MARGMQGEDQGAIAPSANKPVLVTGATGYIGARLVPRLLKAGHRVRCLVRCPRKLAHRAWSQDPHVEIVQGDAGEPADVERAMAGCGAAYYLIHSMLVAGESYRKRDRALAELFAEAATREQLERIIYLGGLGETGPGLSEHLSSRREVERALASGSVPVTVLRAAMIIGSGSASFEILRYLVEHLPVMITPRWVSTESQPIAVRDVLHYLVSCLAVPETRGRALDIGGPDVLSYRKIIEVVAEARGLPGRVVLPVPVLTPRLSALWLHLVTPLDARIARPLAEGLRNRVVCQSTEAADLMPHRLLTVREAVDAALGQVARGEIESSWTAAGALPGDPDWAGGRLFVDERSIEVRADPDSVFRAVRRLGGTNGWHAADWAWRLRGWMDRLVGGPGLRRGRRDPEAVAFGEALDFWRVTGLEPGRRLELRAEMKLPGDALLAFELSPHPDDVERTVLTQTARFKPKGLLGLLYWHAVQPVHGYVFNAMLEGIRSVAEGQPRHGPGELPLIQEG